MSTADQVAAGQTRMSVELRCSENPLRLFAKLKLSGEVPQPTYTEENYIEIACRDCGRVATRDRDDGRLVRVFHLYDFIGAFIRSEMEVGA